MAQLTPEKTSATQQAMIDRAELCRTLMGGTRAMRAAGEKYLPRQPHERQEDYTERLKATVLRNYFKRSVINLVGKVTNEGVALNDDVPPAIAALAEDIDQGGRALGVFAADVFADAMIDGLAFILVERPAAPAQSRAEEISGANRPYWVHLRLSDVLGVRFSMVDGRPIVTQLRFRQTIVEEDGPYGEKPVEYVRVITQTTWELWRRIEGVMTKIDEGAYTLGEVALVPVYTQRAGHYTAEPPLEDLAYLNLEHWQIRSDQRRALSRCSWPITYLSGFSGDITSLIWGPDQLLGFEDAQGKVGYAESNGAHLAAGRDELNDLVSEMRAFALQFLVPNGQAETATGRAIDAGEALSPLQRWALNLKDALDLALYYTAKWMGIEAGGTVQVPTDFLGSTVTVQELQLLFQARQAGEISHQAFIAELVRRGLLPKDFDVAEDQDLIDDDPSAAAFSGAGA